MYVCVSVYVSVTCVTALSLSLCPSPSLAPSPSPSPSYLPSICHFRPILLYLLVPYTTLLYHNSISELCSLFVRNSFAESGVLKKTKRCGLSPLNCVSTLPTSSVPSGVDQMRKVINVFRRHCMGECASTFAGPVFPDPE